MVSRGGLLGINCIRSDIYLSAGSPFTCWQVPSSQTKDRPTLWPLLGERSVGWKPTVPETVSSWRKDFITQGSPVLL